MAKKRPAVDFKKLVTSPSGSLLRVMQAPEPWVGIYKARLNLFGDQPGAIVFPEQLLALQQAAVYQVLVGSGGREKVVVEFASIANFTPHDGSGQPLTTIDKVIATEASNGGVIRVGAFGARLDAHLALFTSRKVALKWASKKLLALA